MIPYTHNDLKRFEHTHAVYQDKAEVYRKAARDCLIRIVAIRKALGKTDSKPVEEPNRFRDSLSKLKKES